MCKKKKFGEHSYDVLWSFIDKLADAFDMDLRRREIEPEAIKEGHLELRT
jgi:hypothetical protein